MILPAEIPSGDGKTLLPFPVKDEFEFPLDI